MLRATPAWAARRWRCRGANSPSLQLPFRDANVFQIQSPSSDTRLDCHPHATPVTRTTAKARQPGQSHGPGSKPTTRTIYPNCQVSDVGDESPYSSLCRTQIPLAPAWALSVHKAQGMTLDRVVVNLQSAFEDGQVYVALSRARTLEGLKVEGQITDLRTGLTVNEEVQEFLEARFGGPA